MLSDGVLRIVWTKHAITRAMERFGADRTIRIPNRVIIKAGQDKLPGEDYRIHFRHVVYVCARDWGNIIKIVTVFRRGEESLPPPAAC